MLLEKMISAMGLQATATKRKYELGIGDSDEAYLNCTPPKSGKWSPPHSQPLLTTPTNVSVESISPNTSSVTSISTESSLTTLTNVSSSYQSTTTALTLPENSIAKLEAVAGVANDSWNIEPIVDSISKLQAVAVPGDTWGSDSSKRCSTLATTLLSADELDDDDDEFEDDFEETESIIPTYCPLRYPCLTSTGAHQQHRTGPFPTHGGYGTKPSFYTEPFPQQNCSRTAANQQHHPMSAGPHHLRPHNGYNSWSSNNYYGTAEPYPPNQQQTIRCAENGKSYLELGTTNFSTNNKRNNGSITSNNMTTSATSSLGGPGPPVLPSVAAAANTHQFLGVRHPQKICCDGRGGWCNNNKQCYKDKRLKIRNLSMFKLSRFRQVTEQSLYRSVLICNTLKYIDKEIEMEEKDLHTSSVMHSHSHPQQGYLSAQAHLRLHPQPAPLTHPHSPQATTQPPAINSSMADPLRSGDYYNQNHHRNSISDSIRHHQHQQQHHQAPVYVNPQQQQQQNMRLNNTFGSQHITPPVNSELQPQPQQQQPPQQQLQQTSYDSYPFKDAQSGRATPFPSNGQNNDNDSGFGDDDCNRSINWSSVLNLSAQSALDPLNNNDLFTTLTTTITPSSITTSNSNSSSSINISSSNSSNTNSGAIADSGINMLMSSSIQSTPLSNTNWEYNFLDMDVGLTPEFTELLPAWKISSDDVHSARLLHETELETPAHIMVGS